jgi:SAM-dependent methyltransferase
VDGATTERARQGLKFGPAAADYDRGRPGPPAAAVELVASALALPPSATVVDLGAGTGKLTALLARRFDRVVAVEPLAPMREVLAAQLPQVQVREGTAERLPLAGAAADAVFVADAFHWFDPAAALVEVARVLRPGGGLVLLWNIPTGGWDPRLPVAARELTRAAIARGGEPGGPRLERGEWREPFAASPFEQLHHETVSHDVVRDRDGMVANFMSISSIAGLPAGDREALRAELRELLPEADYRQRLRTDVYWAQLVPARWCDRCGRALADGGHEACTAARALEPPRYCPRCRRRLKVQVLPGGWSARCVAHGDTRSG